jgi:hypothetical protein
MVTPAAHFCTGAIPLGKTLAATAATRRPWFVTLSDKRRSFRSAVCHLEARRGIGQQTDSGASPLELIAPPW